MLVYIWLCVMLQTFAPGGERLASMHVNAVQSYVRAQIDTLEPAAPLRPTPTQRVRRAPPGRAFAR
jgi:hypothetical protein